MIIQSAINPVDCYMSRLATEVNNYNVIQKKQTTNDKQHNKFKIHVHQVNTV